MMKTRGLFCALICTGIALATPSVSRAQQYEAVPVTISKEKVKVDGVICYSHVVREKQTLYSICKVYQVSPEDIYKYNPGIKENGLKKNTILIIPSVSQVVESDKQKVQGPAEGQSVREEADPGQEKRLESVETAPERLKEDTEKGARKRKVHTVKWYENIDDIADRYGVSVEAIMEANSLKDRKLKSRQKLQIPSSDEAGELSRQHKERAIVQIEETQPG